MKHLDEQKKESFDLQLNAPLEGMGVKAQRWTAEQEAEDFMNLLNGG